MAIATQTTFPSFGYWLENGATTCWENYRGVADISPAADGYDRLTIAPHIGASPGGSQGAGPAAASAMLSTARGTAAVSWSVGANYEINATVPLSSVATLLVDLAPL